MDFRYPNITEGTEREQIIQLKNYLFHFVDQLQYVLGNFDSSIANAPSASKKDSVETSNTPNIAFSDIKSLIIKSADIVNAYYEKIKYRLDGVYAAQSEFGTFKEQTQLDIEANSTAIELNFADYQKISSDVSSVSSALRDAKSETDASIEEVANEARMLSDVLPIIMEDYDRSIEELKGELRNLNFSLAEVSANIKPGLLYYDGNGIPVYGLEIGQRTMIDGVEVFDKFARFTSDRLSFYDNNDNEVAYISDRKLYINHAEIKISLKMGGFVKTVLSDGSIVKRWTIGGEG